MPVMCLVHGDTGMVWAVRWAGLRPPLLSAHLLPLPNCLYILRPFLEWGVATKEWGGGVVYTPGGYSMCAQQVLVWVHPRLCPCIPPVSFQCGAYQKTLWCVYSPQYISHCV